MFRALEYPAEIAKKEYHKERIIAERWNLINLVSDNNFNFTQWIEQLEYYERVCTYLNMKGKYLVKT